jgi:hypothetical protein
MIVQLGDPIRNRKQLIEEGYTKVEIDGISSFDQLLVDIRVTNLRHFYPNIPYQVIQGENENYEIWGLHSKENLQ